MRHFFLLLPWLLAGSTALAGKYTGPRFAEVIASIEREEAPPGERAHRPGWRVSATPADQVVVAARLRTVVSYWDNGWGFPKNIPSRCARSTTRSFTASRSWPRGSSRYGGCSPPLADPRLGKVKRDRLDDGASRQTRLTWAGA